MATDSIQVAIRVRPLIRREKDSAQQSNWRVNGNTIAQISNGKTVPSSCFTFDKVFDQIDSTPVVYEKFAKPVIKSAMLGFNATIFAYGQTSSGKTFTMMGDKHCPGIIPHAINDMFDHINEDPSREYLLVITYMEIYNEVITDLLNPSNKNLKIHENSKREVFVSNITQCPVSGSDQIYRLMKEGEKNRHFGETNMNEKSSRSHTIFAIHIESRERVGQGMDGTIDQDSEDDGAVLVSQLNLVDLAGSERVSLTGAEGQRLKEGAHINKSLFTLGSVIAKLSEGDSFVPFRDSKLTRILQSSLGGNARTGILCTITPASIEESSSTLKFASRAKTIKNCPSVNEVLDDGAMLKRMKKEIRDLKQQLVQLQSNTCLSELQSEKEKFQKQLEEHRAEHERQIQKLAASFLNSSRVTEKEGNTTKRSKFAKRRETWCPGALLSSNPLTSAAAVAQSVLSNVDSDVSQSSSSEESDNQSEFINPNKFEKMLVKEERKRLSSCTGEKPRKVKFSEQLTSSFSRLPSLSEGLEKGTQTEDDDELRDYRNEIEELKFMLIQQKNENEENLEFIDQSNNNLERLMSEKSELEMRLHRAIEELRSANYEKEKLMNGDQIVKYKCEIEDLQVKILQLTKENSENLEFIDQSNNNLESLINEKSDLEMKLHYAVGEVKAANTEKAALQEKISSFDKTLEDGKLQAENIELRERVSALENECNLVNGCAEELQGEINELKIENVALKSRLEESEILTVKLTENKLSFEEQVRNYEQKLEDAMNEMAELKLNLENEVKLKEKFSNESKNLKERESSLKEELESERTILIKEREDMEQLILDLKDSMVDVESERACLQEEFKCLLLEKDSEISTLMKELELVNKNVIELEEESREESESLRKMLEERVSNSNATISELFEEVTDLKERLVVAESDASRAAGFELEKKTLIEEYEELGRNKEQEINDLRRNMGLVEEELNAAKQELHKIREGQEEGKIKECEEESKKSQLVMQLEKLNKENQTLQESLQKVTNERDEIRNELSDAITDSVSIQKDILEAHKKVSNYKERIEQMNQDYTDMCNKVATLEEEVHKTKEELEAARAQNQTENSEETREKYLKLVEENEVLTKLKKELELQANKELEKKIECLGEINNLSAQLEASKQELQQVTLEHGSSRESNKQLQNSLQEMREKCKQLEETRQALEKSLLNKEACYDKLCKEMNDYKLSVSKGEAQSQTFNIELEDLKKEHAEVVRELQNEQREHEALRTRYDQLQEEVHDTKVSLLRDSNRELTQQKAIDKMKSERRETICVQAQLRQELDKEREEKEKKLMELETRCRHLTSEKDLAEHKAEVSQKQLEDIKQQLRDAEQMFSQHSMSIVPSNGNDKAAHRLKQVEFNLDITKQKLEKAELRLKELENDNRQLKGADIRSNGLMEERDVIKAQLVKNNENLSAANRKVNELSIEVTQLRSHIDKLTSDNKKQKVDLERKVEKVEDLEIRLVQLQDSARESGSFEEERKSLRQEIEGLQSRLKSKSLKCEEVMYENKELLKNSSQNSASNCKKFNELEVLRTQYKEEAQKLEKIQGEFDGLKIQYEELSFKYDEQLMKSNENEIRAEEVARLKEEINRLNTQIAVGSSSSSNTIATDDHRTQMEHQADIINSLNMTIQTKDEELEHVTFLFDERELEINEARSSLQEYQNNMKQLNQTIKEKTELFDELQCEVEMVRMELDEARQGECEAQKSIGDLRNIIKEQENEMISLGEKLKEMKLAQSEGQTDQNAKKLVCTVERLTTELEEVRSSKSEIEQKNIELEKTLGNTEEVFRKEREEIQGKNIELKCQLETAQQYIEEQTCKLEEANASIARLRRVITEQEEEIFSSSEDSEGIALLKEELELAKRDAGELKKSLEEERQLNSELKMFLKEKENEVEELTSSRENNVTELTNSYDVVKEELNESKKALILSNKELNELRNGYESLKEEFEEAKKSAKEFKTKNDELLHLIEINDERLLSVQKELENTLRKVSLSDEKEREYIENISSLTQELESRSIPEEDKIENGNHEQLETHILAKQAELEDLQEQFTRVQLENTKQKESMHQQRKQVTEMQNLLKAKQKECADLRNKLKSDMDVSQEAMSALKNEIAEMSAALSNERLQNEDLGETLESSKRHIAAVEDALRKTRQQKSELEAANEGDMKKFNETEKENEKLKLVIDEKQAELAGCVQKIKSMEELEKVNKTIVNEGVSWEKHEKETNRLKGLIDEVQDELDEALEKIRSLEKKESENVNQQTIVQLQNTIDQQKVELVENVKTIQKLQDLVNKQNKGISWEAYNKETDRLKKIIDEVQDELDEAALKINTLERKENEKVNEQQLIQLQVIIDQQKVELDKHIQKIKELEHPAKKKESQGVSWENYNKETDRLKKIIDEVQDELDEAMLKINTLELKDKENEVIRKELTDALKEIERLKANVDLTKRKAMEKLQGEDLESLRIELAGKNMQIQELQYKGYKTLEENDRLRKEVEYGYAKLAKMKQEIRKLREESTQDNTMQIKKPEAGGKSDVGVVSSVAVYSLKAKVGQLESENEKLKSEKEQLEKDKVTLSLLKTDAGNQVSRLTSEIYCLRKQNKEIIRENRSLKGKDEQNVSQHVLAPSNAPDVSYTANMSSGANKAPPTETENRPAQSNWLSPSKANDMFQDKPNQCQQQ